MKFFKLFVLAFIAFTTTTTTAFAQKTVTTTTTTTTATTKEKAADSQTITVKVKNVTCPVDLKMICDNVEKLKGVSSCKVGKKGATTKLLVTMSPSMVKQKDIHAAIEGTGTCEDPNDQRYKVKQ